MRTVHSLAFTSTSIWEIDIDGAIKTLRLSSTLSYQYRIFEYGLGCEVLQLHGLACDSLIRSCYFRRKQFFIAFFYVRNFCIHHCIIGSLTRCVARNMFLFRDICDGRIFAVHYAAFRNFEFRQLYNLLYRRQYHTW